VDRLASEATLVVPARPVIRATRVNRAVRARLGHPDSQAFVANRANQAAQERRVRRATMHNTVHVRRVPVKSKQLHRTNNPSNINDRKNK
jgi:hypothetical protein